MIEQGTGFDLAQRVSGGESWWSALIGVSAHEKEAKMVRRANAPLPVG
jgi:hypothetical protein